MARLIDADTPIHVQIYDDMTEEWSLKETTVAKALDYWADEGCPPTVEAVPVIRCEHCAHKKNCQWYYYSGDDYGFCNWAVRKEHEQVD